MLCVVKTGCATQMYDELYGSATLGTRFEIFENAHINKLHGSPVGLVD